MIASDNSFSGQIPLTISKLKQLTSLHFEDNKFSGSIPLEISMCSEMVDLDLANNSFSGSILQSLEMLTSFNSLNLSQNKLAGFLPEILVIARDDAFVETARLCVDDDDSMRNQRDSLLAVCSMSHNHKKISGKRLIYVSIMLALIVLLFGLAFEVLLTIELDEIKDVLVRSPGENGLSTEQRKRLMIAVGLVSNPSLIFTNEPTSCLDVRTTLVVMNAMKNVATIGRTVVCTIHHSSIDIIEAFDELIFMTVGGELIYSGSLGENYSEVIKYFEVIHRVPTMWMLEISSIPIEKQLDVDFAQISSESTLCKDNGKLVKQLSTPPSGSTDLPLLFVFQEIIVSSSKLGYGNNTYPTREVLINSSA
ncbi:hypothetical protein J5N97_026276 [Dioscorea zingiberensis]|uniref:ABC transporter domain-containing protein n=1 Tax=Dioscorea zingiberensis TaxID=325984 RepID=A0A9D5C2N5_9LILI|nr:hypothetical protein J5N97_026276 [Dioscorea zingiberensis]